MPQLRKICCDSLPQRDVEGVCFAKQNASTQPRQRREPSSFLHDFREFGVAKLVSRHLPSALVRLLILRHMCENNRKNNQLVTKLESAHATGGRFGFHLRTIQFFYFNC